MPSIEELKARMAQPEQEVAPITAPEERKPRPAAAVLANMEHISGGLLQANIAGSASATTEPTKEAQKPKPTLQEIIESKCAPMDFGELIMTGRVTQKVGVFPGKMTVTYRSLVGSDTFWLERNALEQPAELRGLWRTYYQLALCVSEVNGAPKAPFVDSAGKYLDTVILERVTALLHMNTRVLEVLVMNMNWFAQRVDLLLENDFEALKNG
jgi:hypothetical protein